MTNCGYNYTKKYWMCFSYCPPPPSAPPFSRQYFTILPQDNEENWFVWKDKESMTDLQIAHLIFIRGFMAKVQHCHFVTLTKVLLFHTTTWKACFTQNEWSQNRVHVCLNSRLPLTLKSKLKQNTNKQCQRSFTLHSQCMLFKYRTKFLEDPLAWHLIVPFFPAYQCICKRFAVLTSQLKVQGKWCLLQLKLSHSDQHTIKWYFGRKDT